MGDKNLCIECGKRAKHPTSKNFCLHCYEKFWPSVKEDEIKRVESGMSAEEIRKQYF